MSESDCIFCRIVRGELSSTIVHEEDAAIAFRDLNPQAPVHLLVVPRKHVESVAALDDSDAELPGRLLLAARRAARAEGLGEDGYRIVANVGERAGQTVPHLHLHVLGGRRLTWPPG